MAGAERERLRVRAATESLLERADLLGRKAEEEATQVVSCSSNINVRSCFRALCVAV